MDEAVDQHETLVYPPPESGMPNVSRAHDQLANGAGSGAACTVPLVDSGRVVGAMTVERRASRGFDGASVELIDSDLVDGGGYGVFLETDESGLGCGNAGFSGLEWGAIYDNASDSIIPSCG